MESSSDRRTLVRIYNPDAVVRYKHRTKTGFFSSYSEREQVHNLSKSGMAFPINESLEFGEHVMLKVSFSDGKTLRLKGHVRWQNKTNAGANYLTGIQFNAFGRSEEYNSPKALEYLRSLAGQAMMKRSHREPEKH